MNISQKVTKLIEKFGPGDVITYEDFENILNKQAVALYLSRLAKKGELGKVQRGMYYIPKKTKFGSLGPSESEIIESLIDEKSYVSGIAAYNRLGLTTQVPNEITIVGDKTTRKANVGKLKVRYIKAKAPVNEQNKKILLILDAIRDIKKIPDSSPQEALIILKGKIKEFNKEEVKRIIRLSKFYRPFVRSIVGEILEEMGHKEALKLKDGISPLSLFKLNISKDILPLKEAWNII